MTTLILFSGEDKLEDVTSELRMAAFKNRSRMKILSFQKPKSIYYSINGDSWLENSIDFITRHSDDIIYVCERIDSLADDFNRMRNTSDEKYNLIYLTHNDTESQFLKDSCPYPWVVQFGESSINTHGSKWTDYVIRYLNDLKGEK